MTALTIHQNQQKQYNTVKLLLKHTYPQLNNTSSFLLSELLSRPLFLEKDILNIIPRRISIIGLKLFPKNILNKNKIFSHFHHTLKTVFHRVCNDKNVSVDFHQPRRKTYHEEGRALLFLFKHGYYSSYLVLVGISMLLYFLGFIIHLFIIIYNLLSIYSLLLISLLVYIFYYFSLFLEVILWKGIVMVITVFLLFFNVVMFKSFFGGLNCE